MWLTPVGGEVGSDAIAKSASSRIQERVTINFPITEIAPYTPIIIRELSFQPPINIIGIGGSLNIQAGFRIHSFTSVGDSQIIFQRQ
jgi:hypothetical protein